MREYAVDLIEVLRKLYVRDSHELVGIVKWPLHVGKQTVGQESWCRIGVSSCVRSVGCWGIGLSAGDIESTCRVIPCPFLEYLLTYLIARS